MSVSSLNAPNPPSGTYRRAGLALLAWLLLDLLLSFKNWRPTPAILPDLLLAPEWLGLWLGLLGWTAWRGPLSRRWLTGLSLVFCLLVLGRYGDVTVPALFGRPINLYWDGAEIPRFLWVSARELPWWLSGAVAGALAGLLWGLYRLVRWALGVAARDAAPLALAHPWAGLVSLAGGLLVGANLAGVEATEGLVSRPVLPTYWRQAQLLYTALSTERVAQILPPSSSLERALAQPPGQALAALGGRDLYLILIESYGALTYDHPDAAQALAPARRQLAADIAAGGRQVVSALVRSPTYGGGTDRAHLSLLSGLDLTDPMHHDLLLTTDRPTLVSLFRAQGYQTFGFYPGLDWEWPERAFYNYEVFVEGRSLDYQGPPLGYWKIPDQYSLARFEQLYPRGSGTPPRWVFFATSTSHLPFAQVPPYQPDWERILKAEPYDPADVAHALADQPDWFDMWPGYLRMFRYTYAWLGGFLARPDPRDTLYILVGDHQPTSNISGEDSPWDVPVHVISRDPELLSRFVALGFRPGLTPSRPTLGKMNELTGILLNALAQPEPEPKTAARGAPALDR